MQLVNNNNNMHILSRREVATLCRLYHSIIRILNFMDL